MKIRKPNMQLYDFDLFASTLILFLLLDPL
jgi:hypothetical protein